MLRRLEPLAIDRGSLVQQRRRKVRGKREGQAERRGDLCAERARPEDPNRHRETATGNRAHRLPRLRRAEVVHHLHHVLGKRLGIGIERAPQRVGRRVICSWRATQSEINATGKQRRQRAELLRHLERRVIGQHDAAGANANGLRAGTDMANQHRGRGARNAGHVVMLGQPEAVIAPRFRMLREIEHVAERLRCRAALDDGRKIEHREGNAQFANAAMPVWARPRISAWMSWVPS